MIFSWILVGIAFLVACGLLVALLNVIFKEKEKQTDDTLVLNFSNFLDENGRAITQEKEVKRSASTGRMISRGIPKDVRILKEGEKIEMVDVIYEKDKDINLPKGSWSKDCNIKIILPPEPECLPEEVKKNPLGKLLAQLTEEKNYHKMVEEIIREGSNRKTQMLNTMPDGEVSEAIIDLYEGIIKQITDASKEKKASTFERVSTSSQGAN